MEQDEVVQEFLVESHENLDAAERDLLALEEAPGNADALASAFRNIHTIKGTSSFLGFERIQKLTHAGEGVLSRMRDGTLAGTPELHAGLLRLVDALRALLAQVERTGSEGADPAAEALTEQFVKWRDSPREPPSPAGSPSPSPSASPVAPALPAASPQAPPPPSPAEPGPEPVRSVSDSTVRVDVTLLDGLMNVVGELVLARNQLLKFTDSQRDPAFLATSARINALTNDLQERVMRTRMQPIDNVWNKFPRLVRDLEATTGKAVTLVMEGRDTELDKSLIEAIRDPLTHMVRNAVDHGLEAPEARRAAGKPAAGRVTLRAYHEGGLVIVEMSDDGAGISAERVRKKALEKGLLAPERAPRMSERELVQLIFLPGFSTAEKVTSVSGRGVGMDVVKTHIEKVGGAVEVLTEPGRGTTFRIKLPLTLAIIPALLVLGGGERFAIPQVNLLELIQLDPDERGHAVESVNGAPVFRLRGRLLPLVRLGDVLGLEGARPGNCIVVLQGDGRSFGLLVDAIGDSDEIVVKPLSDLLRDVRLFSGATVLGDGGVALILDVTALAQEAGLEGGLAASEPAVLPAEAAEEASGGILLFRSRDGTRLALPLPHVARLEDLLSGSVEHLQGRPFIQYRGGVMPLVWATEVLAPGSPRAPLPESLQVVVHRHGQLNVGIVVDDVVDVVYEPLVVQPELARPGVLGHAVIQAHVTEVVSLPDLLAALGPLAPVPEVSHG